MAEKNEEEELYEAKVRLVACELAGDVFRQNKLPGHGGDWVNQYWVAYVTLAVRIVKALDRVNAESRHAHG